MSGGSMDYLYRNVERVLEESLFELNTPYRRAFARHLWLVARALHDIEWVDSGDYSPGAEEGAIRSCLNGEDA